ncbi:MAG: hypothetical protein ACYCY9_13285 [Thiobacillus sp.]
MKSKPDKSKVQGEGDYASAKKFDDAERAFVESGKVEQAAKAAAPRNAQEEEEMRKAEAEGRSHAKGTKKEVPGETLTPGRKPGGDASDHEILGKPKPDKLPVPGR